MSEEDYIKRLQAHDWYYFMSDDHSAYKAGRDNLERMSEARRLIDPDGTTWNKYAPAVFQVQPMEAKKQ